MSKNVSKKKLAEALNLLIEAIEGNEDALCLLCHFVTDLESDEETMILLTGNVEISDQYGTSKTVVIGVFDNEQSLTEAKEKFEEKYYKYRNFVKEQPVVLNEVTLNA